MTAFKYYLGLDMGTNSVGWAATDPEYRLLKAKGKDLWGIREFNEASGAVERRTHRISRRRRQREQVRIGILKDYFHDAICEVDPSFFQRLENSKYHEEDKDVEVRYKNNIFNDSNYTDKDYFNEYPTIYHLRNELISSTEKHDVRLVFLALLNMFKHRGHFLNAGLGENNGESNIDNAYFELTELLSELTEYHLSQDIDCKQIEAILSRRDMSRTHKAEELAGVLHVDLKNKPYKELIRGLCGLKFNACVVFPDVQSEEVTKLDICLSESTFDEKSDEIANIIGEDYFEIIMAMKEMFDIGSLASIMKGHNYLSQARVASYTKHKEDLKLLKEVKIDGERISVELKQDIYKAVFQKGKKVTKKQLCKYLHTRGIIETEEQVTGVDVSINNALTTYGKFKPIFGEDISKDSVQKMIEDAALNYGYSLLLSTCARETALNGYITQIGLFHDNIFNQFNLASDLMEPFRPIVDNLVKTMHPDKFEHDEKVEILKMLQKEMIIAGRKECVNNAMKIYCRSIFDALNEGDISLIKFYKDEL